MIRKWTATRWNDHGRTFSTTLDDGRIVTIEQRRARVGRREERGYSTQWSWAMLHPSDGGPAIAHFNFTGQSAYLDVRAAKAYAVETLTA